MYGWAIIQGRDTGIENSSLKHIKTLYVGGKRCDIYQNHFPKFENDKVNIFEDNFVVLLDGVILNNHELMKKYTMTSWSETIKKMYLEKGASFVNELRGSFNGFFINIDKGIIEVFTNHLGEREVFYKIDSEFNIVSSNFNFISEALKYYKVKHSLNKEAVMSMIGYAHMLDDFTYIETVKRLLAGRILTFDTGYADHFTIERYHQFKTEPLIEDKSFDELIDIIDETFNKAFIMQMEKDREYDYRSIIDISGGYDSRVVAFAAKRFGYEDVVMLSYSDSRANENKVVNMVLEKLNFDYYFKAMDYPSFLYEVSEIVRLNYGLTLYSGITGGKQFLQDINHERLGIEHTGLLGDVFEGSFSFVPEKQKPADYPRYRYNRGFEYYIKPEYYEKYDDFELMAFYMRGLNFGLGTHLIRRNYNETFSAFMDVDVLELMFKIPLKKRMTDKIYIHWMDKYYPEASNIVYAKTMVTHPHHKTFNYILSKMRITLPYYANQILVKLGLKKNYNNVNSMNPFDYWYKANPKIREFIDSYLIEHKHLLDIYPELKELNKNILNSNVLDKTIYMTAIEAIRQYSGE